MHLKPILRVMLRAIIFLLKNSKKSKHLLNCEVMLHGLEDDSVSVIVKGG